MHISKIVSITSVSLLLSTSSIANAAICIPGHFLAGAEVGYIVRQGNLTASQFNLYGIPVVGEQNEYVTNHGTIYGGFLGYQLVLCKRYVLGVEGNFDLGRYEQVTNFPIPLLGFNANANMAYFRDSAYGASARIGYKVNPCLLPYVRIGAIGGQDHFIINYTGLLELPTWDHFEEEKTNWNWLVGAGLEVPLFSKRFTMRFEYDYIFARDEHYCDGALPVEAQYCYSPHGHIVKLQWVWNFC
jgi:opacity protein-like surface antigen